MSLGSISGTGSEVKDGYFFYAISVNFDATGKATVTGTIPSEVEIINRKLQDIRDRNPLVWDQVEPFKDRFHWTDLAVIAELLALYNPQNGAMLQVGKWRVTLSTVNTFISQMKTRNVSSVKVLDWNTWFAKHIGNLDTAATGGTGSGSGGDGKDDPADDTLTGGVQKFFKKLLTDRNTQLYVIAALLILIYILKIRQ